MSATGSGGYFGRGHDVQTLIALFRGINVGGAHSLPMKELAALLERLGALNVKTYIQSGNVVFQHKEKNCAQLGSKISTAVKKQRGFEPVVLVLGVKELERAISGNPFPEGELEPATLHVGFLASAPKKPDLETLESLRRESERFLLKGCCFYLHAPEGVGRSKLAARTEKLLGVSMTDRNWRTVCKIRELAKELG